MGTRGGHEHCLLGWLLEATEWDAREATRLAQRYLFPALPEAQRRNAGVMASIYSFNDGRSLVSVLRLVDAALAKAAEHG